MPFQGFGGSYESNARKDWDARVDKAERELEELVSKLRGMQEAQRHAAQELAELNVRVPEMVRRVTLARNHLDDERRTRDQMVSSARRHDEEEARRIREVRETGGRPPSGGVAFGSPGFRGVGIRKTSRGDYVLVDDLGRTLTFGGFNTAGEAEFAARQVAGRRMQYLGLQPSQPDPPGPLSRIPPPPAYHDPVRDVRRRAYRRY